MIHYILRLACSDVTPSIEYPLNNESLMQALLMREFFANIKLKVVEAFFPGLSSADVCGWGQHLETTAFLCMNEKLLHIKILRISGNFQIGFLPPTVTRAFISECNLDSTLDTRRLPSRMACALFSWNMLYGTLDLTTLPERMREFHVAGNHFIGNIALLHLPPNLEKIDIRANQIKAKRLYYDKLPDSLRMILIDGSEIREIVPLSAETQRAKKWIFQGSASFRVV